ncbi:MAG TPA: ribokinase [Solirubrobacteraceae bacterium]|jgi:ribokinase|nr:ribokinase [Solirubrobacteraceae bacterium]
MSSPAPRRPTASVLVVGSINEDVVLEVPRFPQPGETLPSTRVTRNPGGKGANQAVAAARAGVEVQMIGRVGDDPAGGRMVDALRAGGVGACLVEVVPETPTGAAYITLTPDGENTIVIDSGANGCLSREDVLQQREAFAGATVMLAQLEVPVDAVTAAVDSARTAGLRPAVTLSPPQRVPLGLLDGLDPLLVNEHEAAFLLGDPGPEEKRTGDAEQTAERLLQLGPRSVVITLGAAGAVYADLHGVFRVPAHRVEAVLDTTGAGDAFAGALAADLALGEDLAHAVGVGVRAGADAVGRPGAR